MFIDGSLGMAFVVPSTTNFQNEPEKVNLVVERLFKMTLDAKKLIEELLYMLDLQEKVPWPDMLEKFSALASAMSTIQTAVKKSALQSGPEDNGSFLRSHVMVTQRLQYETDPQLQQLTEMRVHSWNHDLVPEYLRTKPNPEMEREEEMIDSERSQKSQDVISRQIVALNKNIDLLLTILQNLDRSQTDNASDRPTNSAEETNRVVRALMCGEGLRRPPVPQQQPPPPSMPQPQMGMMPMGPMHGMPPGMQMPPQQRMPMMPHMNITR
ncbi:unnamed protein product [Caenorhabditis auriculariae]|uniref:Mediator of RNA polymerase II transcription subunit 8 n=1 Tax=Caenorhabditis auriculariae TaxID=2777116 RepID=A0A8S1HS29_9PELO|nr:unnamed protein product [Caenorhabditis auriculariae]